jgi:hypothetical protein
MFAIAAAVLAILGFLLDATASRTGTWDSPQALGLAALACLALHLSGVTWSRK